MCRASFTFAARARLLTTAAVVAIAMSTPVHALSNEEWLMAFVRFVEWPASMAEKTLTVCQPADTPLLELDGKQVRGLSLQVRRVTRPAELTQCHLLAALQKRESDWAPWLNALRAKPVLAVGAGSRFCEQGGAVCIVNDDATGAEKYQLNLETLSRSGFKVNSQLLRPQPQRAVAGGGV